ncbi:MAG: hypothetical protein ABW217_12535 [Polyangiaceae bacterium]
MHEPDVIAQLDVVGDGRAFVDTTGYDVVDVIAGWVIAGWVVASQVIAGQIIGRQITLTNHLSVSVPIDRGTCNRFIHGEMGGYCAHC